MSTSTETFQKDTNSHDSVLAYKSMLSALSDGELDNHELDDLLEFLSKDTQEAYELHSFWKNIHISKHSLKHESQTMVNQDLHELIRAQLNSNKQKQNVFAFGQAKVLEKPRTNKHFSFGQSLGIAASVMFAVVFTWLGTQAPVRENVLAFFENERFNNESFASGKFENERLQAENPAKEFKTANRQSEIPAFSQNFPQIVQQQRQFSHPVVAGAGNQSTQTANGASRQERPVYLSQGRMNSYMRLHANNASLNSNQGIIPFARLSADQQLTNF